LAAGRWFTEEDVAAKEDGRESGVIVNESLAHKFFPGGNPLGHPLLSGDKKLSGQIVGVVSDYHSMGAERPAGASIFWPDLRVPSATLIVRSTAPTEAVAAAIRNLVRSLDRSLAPPEVISMQHYVDEWLSQHKFNTLLLAIFAGLALLLGAMGIYGVLANLVASRTREIGIRVAIGAEPGAIRALVLRQGMMPVAIGLCAGMAGSLALARFVEALLFHVAPRDPLALAGAPAAILAAALAGIFVPVRRATRVDSTVALREE
jgi:hypothetical protein